VTSIPVRHRDAERGIKQVVLQGECDVTQRAGWFPAVAPLSAGETSSWLERSPSMSQL
jgi:hypothetical protein